MARRDAPPGATREVRTVIYILAIAAPFAWLALMWLGGKLIEPTEPAFGQSVEWLRKTHWEGWWHVFVPLFSGPFAAMYLLWLTCEVLK
jgi:hypothetical protein